MKVYLYAHGREHVMYKLTPKSVETIMQQWESGHGLIGIEDGFGTNFSFRVSQVEAIAVRGE